jgi:hypothetical protein
MGFHLKVTWSLLNMGEGSCDFEKLTKFDMDFSENM